jgi:hypothetical protein
VQGWHARSDKANESYGSQVSKDTAINAKIEDPQCSGLQKVVMSAEAVRRNPPAKREQIDAC